MFAPPSGTNNSAPVQPLYNVFSSVEGIGHTDITKIHSYSINWTSDQIDWGVDGKVVRTLKKGVDYLNCSARRLKYASSGHKKEWGILFPFPSCSDSDRNLGCKQPIRNVAMGERSSQLGKGSSDNECHGEERNSGVSMRGVKIYIQCKSVLLTVLSCLDYDLVL